MLDKVIDRDSGLNVRQECCIYCSVGQLDWLFDRNGGLSVWLGCWMGWFTGIMGWVFHKVAGWSLWQGCFWQGCLVKCLAGMLDSAIDRDAGLGVGKGMLDWLLDRDAGCNFNRNAVLIGWHGCWIKCLQWTLHWVFGGRLNQRFDTKARLIVGQWCCMNGCQGYCIKCLAGVLDWVFVRDTG